MASRNTRVPAIALRAASMAAVLTLAACGGGGGGSGPVAPPTPPSSVPANPPALPTVSYQGRDTSAALSEANVGALADSMFFAIVLGLDTATPPNPRSLQPGVTDSTNQDGQGGSERMQGRMNADGTGWYSASYVNWHSGDGTLNGMLVDEILQATNGVWLSRRASYHDLGVTVGARSATYAGHMTLTRSTTWPVTASGTIRVRNASGVDLMARDLVLTYTGSSFGFELGATGRVFEATHGWVDLSFTAPWVFARNEGLPAYGGPMVGTAADGRALRLVSLTPDVVSLQYAAATPDRFDRGARLTWNPLFAPQTSRARLSRPVADAGPSLSVLPGTRLTLEGGYSSHAETPFLRHQWTLLFRPPGSVATLSHINDVSPTLTLDVPGRYLLQLVVSDEIRSSKRDFVAISADPGADPGPFVFSSAQLGPSTVATIGATVTVDGSRFTPRILPLSSSVPPEMRVWGPHGDTLLTSQIGDSLTFVAAEPGIYRAVLGTQLTVARGFDTQYFSVLTDLNFTPSVWIQTNDDALNLVAADIDADGYSDLVTSQDNELEVFFGGPPPDFVGPAVLSAAQGSPVAVGDLTGDGRADIATADFDSLAVYAQNADRSFTLTTTANTCAAPDESIVIADINGDGRNDLAMSCYQGVAYRLGLVNGTLDTERTIAIGNQTNLVAGDLNDDGFDDLVVATQRGQPNIGILYGQAGTAPQPVQWLPFVAQSHDRMPQLAVADVNGDGRADLVYGGLAANLATGRDTVRVFHQSASGELVEAQVIDGPFPRLGIFGISVADLNHDGALDVGVRTAPTFLAHYQVAPGRFGERVLAALECVNQASGDFNGDGLADIACSKGGVIGHGAVGILFGVRPDP